MDFGLQDKVALGDRRAHGLGRAIGRAFAAIRPRRGQLPPPARAGGGPGRRDPRPLRRGSDVPADVVQPAEVPAMFDRAQEQFAAPADILVNNAAVCPTGWVKECRREWNKTLAVNLTGIPDQPGVRAAADGGGPAGADRERQVAGRLPRLDHRARPL